MSEDNSNNIQYNLDKMTENTAAAAAATRAGINAISTTTAATTAAAVVATAVAAGGGSESNSSSRQSQEQIQNSKSANNGSGKSKQQNQKQKQPRKRKVKVVPVPVGLPHQHGHTLGHQLGHTHAGTAVAYNMNIPRPTLANTTDNTNGINHTNSNRSDNVNVNANINVPSQSIPPFLNNTKNHNSNIYTQAYLPHTHTTNSRSSSSNSSHHHHTQGIVNHHPHHGLLGSMQGQGVPNVTAATTAMFHHPSLANVNTANVANNLNISMTASSQQHQHQHQHHHGHSHFPPPMPQFHPFNPPTNLNSMQHNYTNNVNPSLQSQHQQHPYQQHPYQQHQYHHHTAGTTTMTAVPTSTSSQKSSISAGGVGGGGGGGGEGEGGEVPPPLPQNNNNQDFYHPQDNTSVTDLNFATTLATDSFNQILHQQKLKIQQLQQQHQQLQQQTQQQQQQPLLQIHHQNFLQSKQDNDNQHPNNQPLQQQSQQSVQSSIQTKRSTKRNSPLSLPLFVTKNASSLSSSSTKSTKSMLLDNNTNNNPKHITNDHNSNNDKNKKNMDSKLMIMKEEQQFSLQQNFRQNNIHHSNTATNNNNNYIHHPNYFHLPTTQCGTAGSSRSDVNSSNVSQTSTTKQHPHHQNNNIYTNNYNNESSLFPNNSFASMKELGQQGQQERGTSAFDSSACTSTSTNVANNTTAITTTATGDNNISHLNPFQMNDDQKQQHHHQQQQSSHHLKDDTFHDLNMVIKGGSSSSCTKTKNNKNLNDIQNILLCHEHILQQSQLQQSQSQQSQSQQSQSQQPQSQQPQSQQPQLQQQQHQQHQKNVAALQNKQIIKRKDEISERVQQPQQRQLKNEKHDIHQYSNTKRKDNSTSASKSSSSTNINNYVEKSIHTLRSWKEESYQTFFGLCYILLINEIVEMRRKHQQQWQQIKEKNKQKCRNQPLSQQQPPPPHYHHLDEQQNYQHQNLAPQLPFDRNNNNKNPHIIPNSSDESKNGDDSGDDDDESIISATAIQLFGSFLMRQIIMGKSWQLINQNRKTKSMQQEKEDQAVLQSGLILVSLINAIRPAAAAAASGNSNTQILALSIVDGTCQTIRHCVSMEIDYDSIIQNDNKRRDKKNSFDINSSWENKVVIDKMYEAYFNSIEDTSDIRDNVVISNYQFNDVDDWAKSLIEQHQLLPPADYATTNTTNSMSKIKRRGQSNLMADDDTWKHILVRLPMPTLRSRCTNLVNYGFLPLQTFRSLHSEGIFQQPSVVDIGVWNRRHEILLDATVDQRSSLCGINGIKVMHDDKMMNAGDSDHSRKDTVDNDTIDNSTLRHHFSEQESTSVQGSDLSSQKKVAVENMIIDRAKEKYEVASFNFLRGFISWCSSDNYPHAPLGEVCVPGNIEKFKKSSFFNPNNSCFTERFVIGSKTPVPLDGGRTFLGRRWVWDEGQYTDGICFTKIDSLTNLHKKSSLPDYTFIPISKRAYCDCGRDHYNKYKIDNSIVNRVVADGPRRSERGGGSSVRMSNVLHELAEGGLNPHTLISCDDYAAGPEFRLLQMTNEISSERSEDQKSELKNLIELSVDSNINPNKIQPFAVKICPDAAFIADLHAHLSESEIIGLLGGRYVASERCLYVQAAFPCKSTSREDAGLTDVEMDPVSQISAGNAIVNQGMTVVGWYHSHPKFNPDPSITDIENQSNYQQLFQSDVLKSENNLLCPFVGLIIGTYGPNPSAKSVMRWFHVTKKSNNRIDSSTKDINSRSTHSKSEVNFPMKLTVTIRKNRNFQYGGQERLISKNNGNKSQTQKFLTSSGSNIRFQQDLKALQKGLQKHWNDSLSNEFIVCQDVMNSQPAVEHLSKSDEGGFVFATDLFEAESSTVLCQEALSFKALPLAYTREELKILTLGSEYGITDEIRASIMWHAIEREQLCNDNKGKTKPPSSDAILNLLLSPVIFKVDENDYDDYNFNLVDDDAAIVHMIDVVLSHYATEMRKINPMESWSGAWDKTISVGKINNMGPIESWWRSYYSTHIVGASNVKMNKGQKIAVCLLRWAKHMQLNDRNRFGSLNQLSSLLDNEDSSPKQLPNDIEFVSEVMRLFVAKWLEGSTDPNGILIGLKRRGAKKRNLSEGYKDSAKKRRK